MDKETLIRLATPSSIFALAISIATLPLTVKAYGDIVEVKGEVTLKNEEWNSAGKRPVLPISVYIENMR